MGYAVVVVTVLLLLWISYTENRDHERQMAQRRDAEDRRKTLREARDCERDQREEKRKAWERTQLIRQALLVEGRIPPNFVVTHETITAAIPTDCNWLQESSALRETIEERLWRKWDNRKNLGIAEEANIRDWIEYSWAMNNVTLAAIAGIDLAPLDTRLT